MTKKIISSKRFLKNYKKLPQNVQELFNKKIIFLQNSPRHQSLNVHKYINSDEENLWEAYITKNYRFVFEITKENIILRNIGSHEIIDKSLV
jgi:mRNA-degrading endonuclease RelE of RelBE toxin-antitoxin system